jgi:hypothetical protein
MKLLLENWRKYLAEQKEGEGVLLYHATCSPPESFASGIDAKRAKGFGQGEGFYFHRDKARALQHGKDALAGELDKEETCPEGATTAYIVVSDEPVTPETFDIDYEVYAGGFAEFVMNNREYFEPRKEDYGIYQITPRVMQFFTETGRRKAVAPGRPIDRHRAVIISQMAEKLSSEDSEMFKRFEQEILPKAAAIKYNGEEVIYPLRIEDLEGNMVWSR